MNNLHVNLNTKIHTFKKYAEYVVKSKTKYRIHSPFVFSFIHHILEKKDASPSAFNRRLYKYYTKLDTKISIAKNEGAGSVRATKSTQSLKRLLKHVSLPDKYGSVLKNLVSFYASSKVLELGTFLGISTSFLADNKLCKVTSIEANSEILNITQESFKNLNIHNVNFIQAKFDEVLAKTCIELRALDLVFIDGDHTKEATLRYFDILLPFVSDKTIIVFDDIYWSAQMTEAWHEISANKKVTLSIDLFRMGIVFFRKEQLKKEHFTLWY